uniref:Uncharacterized protein n=1 Tax=Rhizophora mucronata TaxID=61149 RepID=A0A2P2PQ68_RHIMU
MSAGCSAYVAQCIKQHGCCLESVGTFYMLNFTHPSTI